MFLGGLPNPSDDSGKCWEKFLEYSDPHYYKKIVLVEHPIKPNVNVSGFWKKYTRRIPYISLSGKKHLKTAWATRSLVDATILMIREAYTRYPSIQKFILIDGKACPLYNLQTIYHTVTSNDKNWIDPLNNSCRNFRNHSKWLFCDGETCLNKSDCSFWSQWTILDVSSIKDLLQADIEKDPEEIVCDNASVINQITVKNTRTNSNKIINTSLLEMNDAEDKPCHIADELYFGFYLKRGKQWKNF